MRKLLPWLKLKTAPFINIETLDEEDIQKNQVLYHVVRSHRICVSMGVILKVLQEYIIIGQAKNLRNRIKTHRKFLRGSNICHDPRYYYYGQGTSMVLIMDVT